MLADEVAHQKSLGTSACQIEKLIISSRLARTDGLFAESRLQFAKTNKLFRLIPGLLTPTD